MRASLRVLCVFAIIANAKAGVISTQSEAPVVGPEDIAQLAVAQPTQRTSPETALP